MTKAQETAIARAAAHENCGCVPEGWKLVPLDRSYDMRTKAIIAYNTATAGGADRDDALKAAWEAECHAAPDINDEPICRACDGSGEGVAGSVCSRCNGQGGFPSPAAPTESARIGEPDYKARFESMVYMIVEITQALGISDEEAACANGNDVILSAIDELKSQRDNFADDAYALASEGARDASAQQDAKCDVCGGIGFHRMGCYGLDGMEAAQQDEREALSDERAQMLWDEACNDGPGRPGWSRHLRFAKAVAHEAIASFLDRTRKYVTNDASREAVIADAVSAAKQVQADAAVGTAVAWLVDMPGEPELGHWFAEEKDCIHRSIPIYAHPDPLLAECVEALRFALAYIAVFHGTPDPTDPGADQNLIEVHAKADAVIAKVQAAKEANSAAPQPAPATGDEQEAFDAWWLTGSGNRAGVDHGWLGVGRAAWQASAAHRREGVAIESALSEIINKIDSALDTGDIIADARRASAALDAIMHGGDLVACAWAFFRDSADINVKRYNETVDFRIGWNACLDALAEAQKQRAAHRREPAPIEDVIACDFCGSQTSDPCHGSGAINGIESKHIHACDRCRHLLPAHRREDQRDASSVLCITAAQILDALELAAPDAIGADIDRDHEQMETEMCIGRLSGSIGDDGADTGPGLFAWYAEYPEEGVIPLKLDSEVRAEIEAIHRTAAPAQTDTEE